MIDIVLPLEQSEDMEEWKPIVAYKLEVLPERIIEMRLRKHSIDELPVVDGEGCVVGLIDIQDMIARGFSVFDTA